MIMNRLSHGDGPSVVPTIFISQLNFDFFTPGSITMPCNLLAPVSLGASLEPEVIAPFQANILLIKVSNSTLFVT